MSTNRGLFRLSLSEEVNYIIYNIYQKNENTRLFMFAACTLFLQRVAGKP